MKRVHMWMYSNKVWNYKTNRIKIICLKADKLAEQKEYEIIKVN